MKRFFGLILVAAGLLLFAAAGMFYMEAQKAEREADTMRQIQAELSGANKPRIKAKIFVNFYNECPGQGVDNTNTPNGMDVVNYCAGVTSDDTDITRQCLVLTLDKIATRDHGYGNDLVFEEPDILKLACGIANHYPEKTQEWDDTDLNDHLNNILQDYANEVVK